MAGRLSSKFNFWKSFFRREYVISSHLDCYRTTAGQSKHVRINLKYAHSWSLKMDQPRSLFLLFLVFLYKNFKFLHQIYVKKCPSSIRCRDSNPRPLECESLPITTRPGLPPKEERCFLNKSFSKTKWGLFYKHLRICNAARIPYIRSQIRALNNEDNVLLNRSIPDPWSMSPSCLGTIVYNVNLFCLKVCCILLKL